MTQTDTPIAEMAERLTDWDRELILSGGAAGCVVEGGAHQHKFNRLGIAVPTVGSFGSCLDWTPLGLALRSHLMGGSDRGK